jgi:hypothetical protein
MTSLVQSTLPSTEFHISKSSPCDHNSEKATQQLLESKEAQILPINENTTKQQLIRHRDRVILNNSNPHSPASQVLIKFMLERQLIFTGTDLRFYEITKD